MRYLKSGTEIVPLFACCAQIVGMLVRPLENFPEKIPNKPCLSQVFVVYIKVITEKTKKTKMHSLDLLG